MSSSMIYGVSSLSLKTKSQSRGPTSSLVLSSQKAQARRQSTLTSPVLLRWASESGERALRQVEFLGSAVASSTPVDQIYNDDNEDDNNDEDEEDQQQDQPDSNGNRNDNDGTGSMVSSMTWRLNRARQGKKNMTPKKGNVFTNNMNNNANNNNMNNKNNEQKKSSNRRTGQIVTSSSKRDEQVWAALSNLELDMQLLDNLAGQKPQLTVLELVLLSASVTAASSSPWIMHGKLLEVLPPTAAAFSAAIGIGAEYVGRVAVADGKEVAAATICCASEAEGFLANAERAKAITPLCVGVSATATIFATLVPILMENTPTTSILNELYLACPLISVLSAAVVSLALQDTKGFCDRAISVGNRRFAKAGLVGRTWKSTSEQITGKTISYRQKWRSFIFSVLPAPIVGSLVPGASLASKSVIVTALAAAQTAYLLADCEFCLARATDAVAIKARSAAVCDTYANQGARSAAILPFTSALSGLCAAATAAIVELPFLETLTATNTLGSLTSQMTIVAFFPIFSTLFAAAASVSKARCEVDAEAAVQAASTLSSEYYTDNENGENENDPILRPFRGVAELIRLVCTSTLEQSQKLVRKLFFYKRLSKKIGALWTRLFFFRRTNTNTNKNNNNDNDTNNDDDTTTRSSGNGGDASPAIA